MATTSAKSNKEFCETDDIGNFLLNLYHKKVFTRLTCDQMRTTLLQEEFDKYLVANVESISCEKIKDAYKKTDIVELISRCDFLSKTSNEDANFIKIDFAKLMKFRKTKLLEYDLNQRSLIVHIVDEESECYNLKFFHYESKTIGKFKLKKMGCYICKKNFYNKKYYEGHVQYHNRKLIACDSDDEYFICESKSGKNLDIFYQFCVKSTFFGFTVKTDLDDVIIEKIIIIKANEFIYVNDESMPRKLLTDKKYCFFIDSHILKGTKQFLVIVYRQKDSEKLATTHCIEYHVLMKKNTQKKKYTIKPYHLPPEPTFKPLQNICLDLYLPPENVRRALENRISNEQIFLLSEDFRSYYEDKKNLTMRNIFPVLKLLLQMEDSELMQNYDKLEQSGAQIQYEESNKPQNWKIIVDEFGEEKEVLGYKLRLKIKANVDARNILDANDEMLITIENTNNTINITGRVNKIYKDNVTFYVEEDLSLRRDDKYSVRFLPFRLTLRCQYRALECLKSVSSSEIERFLFPKMQIDKTLNALSAIFNLNLHDQHIFDNPEQMQAVRYIADSNRLPAPYIVFGPPGTGKTATIVEAILQLYKLRSNTRILVMAGSNSACDEIALRLLRALQPLDKPNVITRIFSRSNFKRLGNIDETLLDFSNMYSTHFYPDIATLHAYRIVICTLGVAGILSLGNFAANSHFSHVFVDEVAASTETEVIMGVVYAMSPKACLILSGDHKQLGPVLQSQRAEELGLGISLMERLLKLDCYKVDEDGDYNREIQTRLKRNYRSHSEIVKIYSDLYYDSELIAMATKDNVNLCKKWHLTPNPDFPILFHCAYGTSESKNNSSSLSNEIEIEAVMKYVKDLMYFGINGEKITQNDIGIISPYKYQYTRIQEQLNLRNWHQIECGSVETFQGKEKDIIIVSFVRSFTRTLGFLEDPRRLNVTLSRPKSLLILIGNPDTLKKSKDYIKIIEICESKNAIVGAKLRLN